MDSYEKRFGEGKEGSEKLDISVIKYFWQASPLASSWKLNIPKFLRRLSVLKGFTDLELRTLSRYFHHRSFEDNEIVFRQGEFGIGFYFIFSGHINIIIRDDDVFSKNDLKEKKQDITLTLDQGDHFGELALLQENNVRSATAVAKESCSLLGIFKPDLEELIDTHPVIATKLLHSVSIIIANRLYSVTKEVKALKFKIAQLEGKSV